MDDQRKYALFFTEYEMIALCNLLRPFAVNGGEGILTLYPSDYILYAGLYNSFSGMITIHRKEQNND